MAANSAMVVRTLPVRSSSANTECSHQRRNTSAAFLGTTRTFAVVVSLENDPKTDGSSRKCCVSVVNGVRHLVADCSGQLLGVLDEVHQRIGHVHVAARRREGVRLLLVHEIELER